MWHVTTHYKWFVFVDARLKEAELRRCGVIRVDAQPHNTHHVTIVDGVMAPDSLIHLPLPLSAFSVYTKLEYALIR